MTAPYVLIFHININSSDRFEIRYDFRFDIPGLMPTRQWHGATISAQPGDTGYVVSGLLVGLSIDEVKSAWVHRVRQGFDYRAFHLNVVFFGQIP